MWIFEGKVGENGKTEDFLRWPPLNGRGVIFHTIVWDSSKVRDLVDSLYKGFPVGYIIVWQNPDVKLKDGTKSSGKKVLIDGQQRITAMAAAIVGQEVLDDHYKWKRISMRLDLDFEEQMNALADRDKLTPKAYREENR